MNLFSFLLITSVVVNSVKFCWLKKKGFRETAEKRENTCDPTVEKKETESLDKFASFHPRFDAVLCGLHKI